MPDCRKSHLILYNFLGDAPRPPAGARAFGARFGALPLTGPPFPKLLDPPLRALDAAEHCTLRLLTPIQLRDFLLDPSV